MNKYLNETVEQISKCVQFHSSLGTCAVNAENPFGENISNCLQYFLDLAKSLGFKACNYDNYIGEVTFGNGTSSIAVLCHLDVVPAGSGWTKDPFGGEISDGKIWGRGTMDDKGPAIACLYAMKALKDEGFVPSKKIKLIVGCDEENGWRCIEHYKKYADLPETGFSPDADFPVIYAEKGIMQVRFHFPLKHLPFYFLEGGKQGNMVCDYCESLPRHTINTALAEELGLTVKGKKLCYNGKSAHGSTPELGDNAILPILRYYEGKNETINDIIEYLFEDAYGLKKIEDETGRLTMSPNIIKYRKNQIAVTVDIRYPASVPAEDIFAAIEKFGVPYETVHMQAPLYHDKNSPLIQTLLNVYEECTGEKAEPIAIGGGTYARALKNCAGFGPEMPGEPSSIHQADEFISIERVELLLNVYKKALERLTK